MLQYHYTCDECGKKETVDVPNGKRLNPYKAIEKKYWIVEYRNDDHTICPECALKQAGRELKDHYSDFPLELDGDKHFIKK